MKRADDFETRRQHLKELSDEALYEKFWSLAEQIMDPLMELGKKNTTPSIERSVLLRMGFSSLEAKAIVDQTIDHALMGKGAGHVVYKVSQIKDLSIREAGLALAQGKHWQDAAQSFKGGSQA